MYQIKIIDKDTGEVMLDAQASAIVYGLSGSDRCIGGADYCGSPVEVAAAIYAVEDAVEDIKKGNPEVLPCLIACRCVADRRALNCRRGRGSVERSILRAIFGKGSGE